MKQQCRTLILTTHSVSLLQDADVIIVLQQGEEVGRGKYAELQASSVEFQTLLGEQLMGRINGPTVGATGITPTTTTAVATEVMPLETDIGTTSTRSSIERDSSRSTEPQQPDHRDELTAENLVDDLETTATGHLERRIYWIYFTSIGLFLTLLIIICTAIMQASAIVLSLFWAYWATHQDDFTNQEFLLYSTSIVLITIISGFLRSILFAHGGINAAKVLYTKLSLAVFHTDIKFFENITIGKLINRFGKDSNTIDDSLPFIMNILLAQWFLLFGSCFIMGLNDPPILIVLVIISIVYHRILRYYRKSSRELRRLDAIYRSPVYTMFLECIECAPILRGLGDQCVSYFDTRLEGQLDASLRVSLSVEVASQWLGRRHLFISIHIMK